MPEIMGRPLETDSGGYSLAEKNVVREYTRHYFVKADSKSQGEIEILATVGLPVVGRTLFAANGIVDATSVCRKKRGRRTKVSKIWRVECSFSSAEAGNQEDEQDKLDPEDRLPEVVWDAVLEERVLRKDYSNPRVPVLNSAGEAFLDNPVTEWITYPVVEITRWEPTFGFATVETYTNKRNADEFYGASPGVALMESVKGKLAFTDGRLLWRVSYRIKFSTLEEKHAATALDQGTYYIDGGTEVPFGSADSPEVKKLDGSGGELATGGTPVYLEFERADEVEFGPLNL